MIILLTILFSTILSFSNYLLSSGVLLLTSFLLLALTILRKKICILDILICFFCFSLIVYIIVFTTIEKNENLSLAIYFITITFFTLYVSTIEKNKINLLFCVSWGFLIQHVILYLFYNSKNIALISYVDSPFITSSINLSFSCFIVALVSLLKKNYLMTIVLAFIIAILQKKSLFILILISPLILYLNTLLLKYIIITINLFFIPISFYISSIYKNFDEIFSNSNQILLRKSYRGDLIDAFFESNDCFTLFGNGLNSNTTYIRTVTSNDFDIGSFHNTFLDLIYCFGIIPIFISFLIILPICIYTKSKNFLFLYFFVSILFYSENLILSKSITPCLVLLIFMIPLKEFVNENKVLYINK